MSPGRKPAGTPTGGQFASSSRVEVAVSLGTDPASDRQWVDIHGTCPNCGHAQEPHKTCEACDPSCPECGGPVESPDLSLCERCQERADDAHWDEEDEFDD